MPPSDAQWKPQPYYRRKPPKVRVVWHGSRPKRAAVIRTRRELADLLIDGLHRPADLCFHTVCLGEIGTDDPIVHCYGRRGSGAFHAEYEPAPPSPQEARPMGSDAQKCARCRLPFEEASPVVVYCPNDACWETYMHRVKTAYAKMRDPKDAEIARLRTTLAAAEAERDRARTRLNDLTGINYGVWASGEAAHTPEGLTIMTKVAFDALTAERDRAMQACEQIGQRLTAAEAERDAAVERAETAALRPMAEAPADGPVLVRFRDNLSSERAEGWLGRWCVMRHEGVTEGGYDMGWSVAAPVGYGGIPVEWLAGWMPLPALRVTGEQDGEKSDGA